MKILFGILRNDDGSFVAIRQRQDDTLTSPIIPPDQIDGLIFKLMLVTSHEVMLALLSASEDQTKPTKPGADDPASPKDQ